MGRSSYQDAIPVSPVPVSQAQLTASGSNVHHYSVRTPSKFLVAAVQNVKGASIWEGQSEKGRQCQEGNVRTVDVQGARLSVESANVQLLLVAIQYLRIVVLCATVSF